MPVRLGRLDKTVQTRARMGAPGTSREEPVLPPHRIGIGHQPCAQRFEERRHGHGAQGPELVSDDCLRFEPPPDICLHGVDLRDEIDRLLGDARLSRGLPRLDEFPPHMSKASDR